jgi:Holliday junction resolvase RusA-like endonuclease
MVVVTLPFPVSTNHLFSNGRSGRFKSERYEAWLQEARYALMVQRPARTKGPVKMEYVVQDGKDRKRRDLSNMLKAPEDLLVKHGIIEADDHTIVREVSLKWSKDVQGIQITIQPVEQA